MSRLGMGLALNTRGLCLKCVMVLVFSLHHTVVFPWCLT